MTVKKIDWKVKMQWNWYKAALVGTAIAVLLAPTAGAFVEVNSEDVENNPIVSTITGFTFGPKTKVMINGEVVALATNEAAAQKAYKAARLAYNAEGVKLLDADVSYELVDKEQDKEAIKGKKLLRNDKLTAAILDHLIDAARSRACQQLSLEARVSNLPAIALYEAYGFTSCGLRKNYYQNPSDDAIIMIKDNK